MTALRLITAAFAIIGGMMILGMIAEHSTARVAVICQEGC